MALNSLLTVFNTCPVYRPLTVLYLGAQYLAQGQFSMQLGGAGIQTCNLLITRQLSLPPELQMPLIFRSQLEFVMTPSSPELLKSSQIARMNVS